MKDRQKTRGDKKICKSITVRSIFSDGYVNQIYAYVN